MALDDSTEDRGLLKVDRQQLSQHLRQAFSVKPVEGEPARLTFDGKSLYVSLGGARFRADATGTWEGEVLIAVEVLRKLGKNIGRGKEPVLVSTDGKELRFGITIVPCQWNPADYRRIELPLGAPLVDILALPFRHSRIDIERSGLLERLTTAETERDRLIKLAVGLFRHAAKALEGIGIAEASPFVIDDTMIRRELDLK